MSGDCGEIPNSPVGKFPTCERKLLERKAAAAAGDCCNNPNGAATDAVARIAAVLAKNAVKVRNLDIIPKLIHLAADLDVNAEGLAAFIADKCARRKPETAEFFVRCIPEDLPDWLVRASRPQAPPQHESHTEKALRIATERIMRTGQL